MSAVETAQQLLQSSSYTMNIAYQGNNIFRFQSVAGDLGVSGYLVDHGDLLNYSFYIGPIDPANYAGELYLGYTYNAYTTPAGVTNLYTNDVAVTVNPDGSETYVVTNGQAQPLAPGQPLPQDVIPCFAAGTRILTDRGEMPVEALRPGDLVATLSGSAARRAADGPLLPVGEPEFRAVCRVGSRTVDFVGTRPASLAQVPVRVEAGALGEGLPHRALVLSPEHCLLLDGHLVPAKLLVNGRSIRRDPGVRSVTYLHVALDEHDVLLAEGAAAESWLDTGNGAFFGSHGVAAHPSVPLEPEAAWNVLACAPHLLEGAALDALRARLDALAASAPDAAVALAA